VKHASLKTNSMVSHVAATIGRASCAVARNQRTGRRLARLTLVRAIRRAGLNPRRPAGNGSTAKTTPSRAIAVRMSAVPRPSATPISTAVPRPAAQSRRQAYSSSEWSERPLDRWSATRTRRSAGPVLRARHRATGPGFAAAARLIADSTIAKGIRLHFERRGPS
jgi:hypothetical protein